MKIYAVRHGHTNYNEMGLCNGDPRVDVHLTSKGILQAEEAANTLKEVPLECIFVSQLPRTRQDTLPPFELLLGHQVHETSLSDPAAGIDRGDPTEVP